MALRLQTFEYHAAFPDIHLIINGRGLPPPPTCVVAPEPNFHQMFKRSKSETAADYEFPRPLMGRHGIATFGYQTVTMDDILPTIDIVMSDM